MIGKLAAESGHLDGLALVQAANVNAVEAQTNTLTSPDPSFTTMMNPNGRSLNIG